MSGVWCFTSATCSYLDRARVLAGTVRRHHPEWTFCLCLADEPPEGMPQRMVVASEAEPFDHIVRLAELDIPDLRRWIFQHALVELCTAVKGPMLQHLLARGARKVVYLDPDIAIFAPLEPIEAALDRHDVVLTPHLLEPEPTHARVVDNEICALRHGIFNLGFLAVANTTEGRRFADWWSARLLEFCVDDPASGLFTDQRWCDHAPVFFPTLHILRDPGYNVASWNVAQRPVTIDPDGAIRAAGHILRFFHFTKIDTVGRDVLEQLGRHQRPLLELAAWYRDRLDAVHVPGLPPGWWAYGHYTDDTPIAADDRRAYRQSRELQQRYADPFASGPDSLQAALGRWRRHARE